MQCFETFEGEYPKCSTLPCLHALKKFDQSSRKMWMYAYEKQGERSLPR